MVASWVWVRLDARSAFLTWGPAKVNTRVILVFLVVSAGSWYEQSTTDPGSGCECLCDLPDKYPLMSLSSVLNCWRYLSLEACGMAQSLAPILGELLAKDVVEEEFELQKNKKTPKPLSVTAWSLLFFPVSLSAEEVTAGVQTALVTLIGRCFYRKQWHSSTTQGWAGSLTFI